MNAIEKYVKEIDEFLKEYPELNDLRDDLCLVANSIKTLDKDILLSSLSYNISCIGEIYGLHFFSAKARRGAILFTCGTILCYDKLASVVIANIDTDNQPRVVTTTNSDYLHLTLGFGKSADGDFYLNIYVNPAELADIANLDDAASMSHKLTALLILYTGQSRVDLKENTTVDEIILKALENL